MTKRAIRAAVSWLHEVAPQLGDTATFAQVDVDTLLPVRGTLQRRLARASVEMFTAVARDPVLTERGFFLELSIPVESELATIVGPDTDVLTLIDKVAFTGSLRGRSVPGFYLSQRAPSDRLGPKFQQRTRLVASAMSDTVVHHRMELWGGRDGPFADDRADALEFRVYPSLAHAEAVFPLHRRATRQPPISNSETSTVGTAEK